MVDVYDELISGRIPDCEAWHEEKALEYIRQSAGSQFDPAVVEALVELVEEEAASLEGLRAMAGSFSAGSNFTDRKSSGL